MLTDNGKNLLLRYLANVSPGFVKEIGVGIGSSPPSPSSNRLDFEVSRVNIITGSITGSTSQILYHGALSADDEYIIKEVGLFPVSTSLAGVPVRGALLTTFEPGDGSVFTDIAPPPTGQLASGYIAKADTVSAAGAAGIRIGSSAAYLRPGAKVSFPSTGDFSQYGPNDEINVALVSGGSNYNIDIKLYDNAGLNKVINLTHSATAEASYYYDIYAQLIGTQNINFASLSQIEITNNGAAYVILDGIRFEEVDLTNPLNSIAARQTVFPTKQKLNGFAMDVEYRLTVNWD